MNVAIIGGTGFVGGYLVDALLGKGHAVSLLVRPGSEPKVLRGDECRLVSGTVDDSEAIDELLKGCDGAIYNIGILREFRSRGITFEAMQYEGAVRCIDAAKKMGIGRFLLMSANGVKGSGTAYQETKFRAEEALKASGLDYTIFRPSVIFGDPRGTMEITTQLYEDMVRPPLPAVGFHTGWSPSAGPVLMSPVHVLDVADAFAAALEDPETEGKTYCLGGPEEVSWDEMVRRIAAAAGKDKIILPMPLAVMKLGAALFDWLPFFPVTRDQLTMLAEGNTAGSRELEHLIGRAPHSFSADNLEHIRS